MISLPIAQQQTRPELTGVSVRGSDEVYTRLMNFKSRLRHDHFGRLYVHLFER